MAGNSDNYDGPVNLPFLIKMCSTQQTKFDVKRATIIIIMRVRIQQLCWREALIPNIDQMD